MIAASESWLILATARRTLMDAMDCSPRRSTSRTPVDPLSPDAAFLACGRGQLNKCGGQTLDVPTCVRISLENREAR